MSVEDELAWHQYLTGLGSPHLPQIPPDGLCYPLYFEEKRSVEYVDYYVRLPIRVPRQSIGEGDFEDHINVQLKPSNLVRHALQRYP
jgi:hypothetical protein